MINIKKKFLLTVSATLLMSFNIHISPNILENNYKDMHFVCYYTVPVEPHESSCLGVSQSCLVDHSLYEECHALLYRLWFFLDVMQSSQNTVFADTTVYSFLMSLLLKVINITTLFNNDIMHEDECNNIINLINYIMETPIIYHFTDLQSMLLLVRNNMEQLRDNKRDNVSKKYACITVAVV